jgi:hypothetical protein
MNDISLLDQQRLDEEEATYERHKADLLATHAGEYVVIQRDRILGVFEDEGEAYNQTVEQLGLTPFTLRQITERRKTYVIGGSEID